MKYLYHLQATWVTVCFKLILASVISIGDFRTAESVPDARANLPPMRQRPYFKGESLLDFIPDRSKGKLRCKHHLENYNHEEGRMF